MTKSILVTLYYGAGGFMDSFKMDYSGEGAHVIDAAVLKRKGKTINYSYTAEESGVVFYRKRIGGTVEKPPIKAQVRLDEMSLKAIIIAGLKAEGYRDIHLSGVHLNHSNGQRDDVTYGAVIDVELPRTVEN